MTSATESMGIGNNNMASALSAGLDTLDLKQSVTFMLYVRQVLPIDGFVFWLKADQLVNPPTSIKKLPKKLKVEGSLHHATVNTQSEDENFSTHKIIFTAKDPVNNLGAMAPDTLYMATVDGNRYAFSARSNWYRQADLYHYTGEAVFPSLSDMVVDTFADLDLENKVVSNSIPIWLLFTNAKTASFVNTFPIYPSYLMPDNLFPPYASVNVEANSTKAIGAGRFYDKDGNRFQLVQDTVEISLFGVRNDEALDWIDAIVQYGLDHADSFGVMNSPVVNDAKRGQVEISALAQKKSITFQVNYYQSRIAAIVQKYILSAFIDEFFVSLD
jgi:hypothetical protein